MQIEGVGSVLQEEGNHERHETTKSRKQTTYGTDEIEPQMEFATSSAECLIGSAETDGPILPVWGVQGSRPTADNLECLCEFSCAGIKPAG